MPKSALTILAVTSTLVLGGMVEANAATLDFTFSFSESGVGTVTGEVDGLSSTTTNIQPASAVILDSFPAALGTVCSTPCNMMASPWAFVLAEFQVMNDQIIVADFDAVNSNGANFLFEPPLTGLLFTGSGTVTGLTTFTPTPLPSALPLFATGLGALGLLGWRRKWKTQA